ncbi:MAG: hypothetical protein MJ073_04970 [Oscillibacter sp.]|nr:hypothetical protein [Oscillibacter sp.]
MKAKSKTGRAADLLLCFFALEKAVICFYDETEKGIIVWEEYHAGPLDVIQQMRV